MKHNKNNGSKVPNLRFHEFTGDWKVSKLGKCSDSLDYGMNASAIEYDGCNKYIRITDIDESSSRYLSAHPVSPNGELQDKYLVQENDILFARTGASTGKSYLYNKKDGKLYFAGFLIRARVKQEYNASFIFAQTQTIYYDKWIKLMSMRSGQPGINSQEYADYRICLTLISEQNKIAQFLSLIDERISTQNKIIEKLESSIKGLNNHLHETYGEEVEICLAKIGITYSGLSGKTAEDFGSGKSYITYLNVYQNYIIDTSLTGNVNIMDGELQNKIAYGDALFTLSSETPHEVGVSAVCLYEPHDTYLNSFCFGYRLHNRDVLIPEYMPYCFSSSKFRKFILPFAQGSTRYNLQKTDFINASFSVPKLSKQKHIANLLYAISQKIWTEKRMLLVCQKQKEYFLRNMFI